MVVIPKGIVVGLRWGVFRCLRCWKVGCTEAEDFRLRVSRDGRSGYLSWYPGKNFESTVCTIPLMYYVLLL